ncbi:hypothetical protein B296_00015530 [Ensete ventricosum]|uniref:Uncharacterized protein n=1 Tax=Ensete ventricosum TaxID=4639 RepID=A0A427A5N5_ENSVE|nr:hypothetical protein B296_00015530 [Ensete ventricosum]
MRTRIDAAVVASIRSEAASRALAFDSYRCVSLSLSVSRYPGIWWLIKLLIGCYEFVGRCLNRFYVYSNMDLRLATSTILMKSV